MPGARWATALSAGLATPPTWPKRASALRRSAWCGCLPRPQRIPVGGVGVAVTVLLNRSPRSEVRSDSTSEGRVVMSVNVMIGAVLILLMITLLSAFALEATVCSVGVPNCD